MESVAAVSGQLCGQLEARHQASGVFFIIMTEGRLSLRS